MPNQRLAVLHISPVHTARDLAHIPVAMRNGSPLTLGHIAELTEGFPPPIGDAVINDGPGLLLIVEKQPWGNTLDVTHKVEAALDALRPGLADLEIDPTIFRPATFIEMSLANLNRATLIGCVLVILVLAFFLNDWRTALISVLAIPTSLIAAALVLHYRGGTINTMVLAGLVIALGEVVDDAIIDVENIMRRLRLNRAAGNPMFAFQVVLNAALEVRSAVVYGSVIVALVLMPVFLLEGLSGSFFRPLALSYVRAILAALFVALTLTPALSLLLLPQATHHQTDAPLVRWLKLRYEKILPRLIQQPKRVIASLVGTIVVALIAFQFLGEEFLPHFKEYDFLMHWVEKPGTSVQAMERITERASQELRAIPGVRIYGENLDVLREQAEQVRAAISNIEGVADLKVQPQILVPQVEVHIRPEAAARFGLTPGEVRRAATLFVKGMKVGEFYEEQKVFDVVVWSAPPVRDNVEALRDLMITTPAGGMVPLREVADIIIAPTPNQITREAASRYTEVTCNVRGRFGELTSSRDLGSVAQEIEKNVSRVHFERGYHPEFLGEYAAQQASKNRILMLSLLAIVGIFLILYTDFSSLRLALLVLLSLPFALVGGIFSVILTGGVLSLGSLVGFVTVLGIAARNTIMLISHYRHLEKEESQTFGMELILRGAQERLAPILMTALAAALALLPIILGGNRPGHEIEHPMAVVILGGLVSSTILNLSVMPVLYSRFGRVNPS